MVFSAHLSVDTLFLFPSPFPFLLLLLLLLPLHFHPNFLPLQSLRMEWRKAEQLTVSVIWNNTVAIADQLLIFAIHLLLATGSSVAAATTAALSK